jgi:type VI secretion system secreted protein VgrG
MPVSLTQDNRLGRLDTPLGTDQLCLARFNGSEGLSELFEYSIEAVSAKPDVDFDTAIGRNCSVTIRSYKEPDRYFNGVLVEARSLGGEAEIYNYRLVLRPWLWLLSRTSDCRIFENQTPTDIVRQVFKDQGFSDFRDGTNGGFPTLDYCVQYRETDLDFVSRLMEQHGIYYYFEHEKGKHVLVLANGKSSHDSIPGRASIPVFLAGRQERRDLEHLTDWSRERRFRSGKFELADYDYLKPTADLKGEASGSATYTKSKMTVFDYPGKYKDKSNGETYAKHRLEAEQAQDRRRSAKGDAVSLFPGGLVSLEKHPTSAENREYLVLRAAHSYTAESYYSGMAGDAPSYTGDYAFLASDIPYRAPMRTPRPLVHGPQTAVVIGDKGTSGEEIDVDEHGRILVRFFWDRKKAQSCRVRIAQIGSGSGWGMQVIPRIGHEVVVEFLEGDPDRPLVTGVVYNGDNKHPFGVPDNKTQSGFKTNSSKGGGGYNELMFEDKKGNENIRMHAQKDHNVTVLNSETVTIGEKFEGRDTSRKKTLKNGSDVLSIENGDQTVGIRTGSQTVNVNKSQTINVETEDQHLEIKQGNQRVNVKQEIIMEAGTSITLKVKGNSIRIDEGQIVLQIGLEGGTRHTMTPEIMILKAPRIDIN